ncbi:MAG: DNA polymerase I [Candidatus Doudnabacteria bacterium]
MNEFKRKLLLIDGHALFHRAFHALPAMSNKDGFPTGAIFGFFSMLFKALVDIKPSHALVTFDVKGPTFRDKLTSDYKATRKPAPDELLMQLPKIKEILIALDIPIYERAGFEADDLLGIIAHKTPKDVLSIIVTGDLDLLQLIDNHTQVYRFKTGFSDIQIFDIDKMVEIYGLHPGQWVDYKAIRGDLSDNIPGVPGIGEKGAMDLMKEFGSLDSVYEAAERGSKKIKEGTIKKLVEGKPKAYLSQKLAYIDQKGELDFDFEKTEMGDYDQSKVIKLLADLGIKSLVSRLPKVSKGAQSELLAPPKNNFPALRNADKLQKQKQIALMAKDDNLLIGWSKHEIYQIPMEKVSELKDVLEDPKIEKIGFDLKTLHQIFLSSGIELLPMTFDVLLASYLANPGQRSYEPEDFSEIFARTQELEKELKAKNILKIYDEIEKPLAEVLIAMENRGVKLDLAWLESLSVRLEKRIGQLIKEIHKLAGQEFNISSPKQLSEILFEKLRIPTDNLKKNKKSGGISTAAGELEKMRGLHPVIELLFEYRELTKLKSTYVDSLPLLVSKDDGRVHTTYSQTIAATGRLSSINPNLQNIPIRTELGNEVRKSFISEKGKVLLSLDYSQIELRIAASLSGDDEMMKIFKAGGDFHRATAARIFNVPEDKVTSNQRRDAKTINFSVLYGVSAFGLSSRSELTRAEAGEHIKKYFETFSKLKKYIDGLIETTRKQGFITNALGRIRYFPDISAPNFAIRGAAERQAVNTPIQSLAADIMKLSMIEIEKEMPEANMILTVHDELVFEVEKGKAEDFAQKIKKIMESAYKLKVPIVSEAKAGTNWAEMEKLEI